MNPYIIIGSIYGLVLGIAAGICFCASVLIRKNTGSVDKTTDFSCSSRGVEIFNRNMTDEFQPAVFGNGRSKSSNDEDNLEYFNRNMDLDYKPVRKISNNRVK